MQLSSLTLFFTQVPELPEPTTASVITYSHQIAWGSKPLTWNNIVPKSTTVFPNPVPITVTHQYYGLTLGDHLWSFETLDSTIPLPKVMECVFSITAIPSGKLMDFYRMRVRATVTYPDGTVSATVIGDDSFWVTAVDMGKLKPKTPIKRADSIKRAD
jgi:hypothetical protein